MILADILNCNEVIETQLRGPHNKVSAIGIWLLLVRLLASISDVPRCTWWTSPSAICVFTRSIVSLFSCHSTFLNHSFYLSPVSSLPQSPSVIRASKISRTSLTTAAFPSPFSAATEGDWRTASGEGDGDVGVHANQVCSLLQRRNDRLAAGIPGTASWGCPQVSVLPLRSLPFCHSSFP